MATSVIPASAYWAGRLFPNQSIDLGTISGINLDGHHSFSIGCWVRVTAPQTSSFSLLQKQGAVGLLATMDPLTNQVWLSVSMAHTPGIQATLPTQVGLWTYVLFTFASNGNGGGVLSLYLDSAAAGTLTQTTAGAPSSNNHFILGGGSGFDVLSVTFWQIAVTATECCQWQTPDMDGDVTACFCFSEQPAQDLTSNHHAISYQGGAQQYLMSPSLQLLNACAQPSTLDQLNPCNGQPFTITSWVYAVPPPATELGNTTLTLLGIGVASASDSLAVQLSYDASASTFALSVSCQGTPATATTSFAPYTWHHVAATYDGQSTITLYVDGAAAGTQAVAAITPLSAPTVVIGGMLAQSGNPILSGVFNGYLQGLGMWSACLTSSQIAQAMTGAPTLINGTDCTAYFDFSSVEVTNQVTGFPAALYDNAVVTEQASTVGQVGSDLARGAGHPLRSTSGPDDAADLRAFVRPLLPGLLDDDGAFPSRPVLAEDRIEQMTATFRKQFSRLPAGVLDPIVQQFRRNLRGSVRAHDQWGGRLIGMFRHQQEGADWAFYYEHPTKGSVRCFAASGESMTPCQAWMVSVVASTLSVVLSMLAVGFVAGTLAEASAKVVTTNYGTFNNVVKESVDATTFIKVIQTIYNGGGLLNIISSALANVSFWSWIFTAITVVLQIASIWLTGGAYLAIVLAQLAFSVAQLAVLIGNRPTGC